MSEHKMTIAKADTNDLETTLNFLNACGEVLENKKFSFTAPEDEWQDWDEDDEDRILIEKIRANIAEEECLRPERVDNRILMYEFLKRKFAPASCNWRRVYYAADALLPFMDPTEDHLEFHPGIDMFHVAPEM